MTNPQNRKHRRPSLRIRKGTVAVGVKTETDSATEQDEAEVAEETTDQAAPEIDEPQDTGDASSATDTEDSPTSEDASSDDAETQDALAEHTSSDDAETEDAKDSKPPPRKRRIKWSRVVAFGVLPVLALLLAAAAGFVKWQDSHTQKSLVASIESVAAAKESTAALLSYQSDSVEKDLGAARDRLTGRFKETYTQLIHDVVIPGAKKDHIAAVATVPAAASVSATPQHAVVLLFVDQTVTVGNDAPTETASTVRVTLDKSGGHWLISSFDPI
jgi:Mce-associated membrane protein